MRHCHMLFGRGADCALGPFIGLALLALAVPSVTAQSYTYHELARPPGYSSGRVHGLNNLGQAVGTINSPATFERLAVIWDASAPSALPSSLGVPPYSWGVPDLGATDINDFGEVIGTGKGVAPLGTPGKGAFHWSAATGFTHLAPVSTPAWHSWQQSPRSINCSGNVVGSDVLFGTFANGSIGLHWNPPSYAPGTHSPPGGIHTYSFVPLSIRAGNDADQVVGNFVLSGSPPAWFGDAGHAFFWESTTGYTTLSAGAFSGEANDVNNCEQVVGFVRYSQNATTFPVLWERTPGGGFTGVALPTLSANPAHGGVALALSDAGQAVGLAKHTSGVNRPVVWDFASGGVVDLTFFLPPPDPTMYATIYELGDVNNQGLIVGTIFEWVTAPGPVAMTPFVLEPSSPPTVQCPASVCPPAAPTFDLLPAAIIQTTAAWHEVEFTVVNGTPGETVYVVDDTIGHYRPWIATQCPFPMPPAPIILGVATVDAQGKAVMTARVRTATPGTSAEHVAVELSTCRLDVEIFTHP